MKKIDFFILLFFIIFFSIQLTIPQNYTFNADEPTHALIGLFYKDLIVNIGHFHSFNDVKNFAVNYIIKYPKISAYFPPLYHLLLATLFLIKESLFLVRILNIILTILTAIIIYKLSFELNPKKNIAILSAIFFLSFSLVFYYTDKIMVDVLQILTFSSVLLFYLKLRDEKKISLINIAILSFLLVFAFLTKYFSIFLPIIILVDAFFHNKKLVPYFLLAIILSIIILSPYLFFYIKFKLYRLLINISQTPQIVQVLNKQTKLSYFDVFYIFGFFIGPLVAISTIWFIWKNFKNPLIISWFFIPLFVFLFLFKQIEHRFLFILMPIYSLACSTFVFKNIEKIQSKKGTKLLFAFILILLFLQFASNIYIKSKDVYYPINDVMKSMDKDGNILMTSEGEVYSSIYILYGRLNNIKGNFIRPCVLDKNNMTKDFLNEWGIRYIIDENNTIDENLKNSLNLNLFREIKANNISIRIFETKNVGKTFDCNFICALQKEICKGYSFSDIFVN